MNKIVPKKIAEIEKTKPHQLSLFELLTENDVLTGDGNRSRYGADYSQSIELYDFMPRFVWERQGNMRKAYNGLLPGMVREFECRKVPFELTLTPATITRKNESKSYYPGATEDIVETILRKLYLDNDPKLFDGKCGMTFTINQIRLELERQNHSRSHYEVIQALLILKGTQISILNKNTGVEMVFNPLETLVYKRSGSGNEPCYLIFSSIVTDALNAMYFRRYNYKQVMQYRKNFARLLHRRMSHHFIQASEKIPYEVRLSTLLRDFGLNYERLTYALRDFKEAIAEMQTAYVVSSFTAEPIRNSGNKKKIDDYHLYVTPTANFSFEIKNSNVIRQKIHLLSDAGKLQKSLPGDMNQPLIFPILPKVRASKE